MDGCWVFGGIERDSKKVFLEIVEDRSAATLVPIIKKWIKKGSIFYSDCWRAYSQLSNQGYQHLTVNHSKQFVNPENGCCTTTIESTWRAVKPSLPRYGTTKGLYDSYFAEFMIRRKYLSDSSIDPVLKFLDFLRRLYAPGHFKSTEPIELKTATSLKKRKPLSSIENTSGPRKNVQKRRKSLRRTGIVAWIYSVIWILVLTCSINFQW